SATKLLGPSTALTVSHDAPPARSAASGTLKRTVHEAYTWNGGMLHTNMAISAEGSGFTLDRTSAQYRSNARATIAATAKNRTNRRLSIVPAAEKNHWVRRPAKGRPPSALASRMFLPNWGLGCPLTAIHRIE